MHLAVIRLLFIATLVSSLALPGNPTVEEVSHPQCPFNAEASIAEDGSYLDIVYSTKGTTPNSLAAFGSRVSATNSKRKCYVAVSIRHNDQDTARLRTAGVEVTGNVKLDEGLVAKIETSLVMGASALSLVRHPNRCFFDRAHAELTTPQMNFTTASISGPKNGDFIHRADLTSPELHADCNSPKRLTLVSVFSVSAQSASIPSSATGELGKESTLKKRIFLKWVDLCDTVMCRRIDRYGNVVFEPPYNAETCPENWLR